MGKKQMDPQLMKWLEELNEIAAKHDRWFTRLVRAVKQCHKLRSRQKFLGRKVNEHPDRPFNRPR